MNKISNTKSDIRFPFIIAIAVVVGIFIGATMLEPKFSIQGISGSIAKFKDVILSIDKNYVDEVDASGLVDDAIVEMLRELDPHSTYIPKEEVERLNAQLRGVYEGIGIQFDILRDTVYVIRVLEGGPSKTIGLQSGDKIIQVEGEIIAGTGITNKGVTDRLLGQAGSEVTITILRENTEKDYTITRGTIPQRTIVSSYMINKETGYIKISRFGSKTYDEFKNALSEMLDKGMTKLVLDLQGNPGGLMSAAEDISDELIAGRKLIVSQKSVHDRYNSSFYARKEGIFENGLVIVLVDEYSASASEIVAGALQDHDRALIVGRRTFGKGLVQMPISLNDRSELRLTIARYYTPSGRSIQKPYNNGEDYYSDISSRYDHGEFFHADSIKFEDSLKFETAKGRTIYGGGGIMPDYFVPYDTSMQTAYYSTLRNKRAVREYTFNYFIAHNEALGNMHFDDFMNSFVITDEMLANIVEIGEELGIAFNKTQFQHSLTLLKGLVKADIASFVWGENGYYPVINPVSNEIYIRALELFDDAALLAEAY